jgi:hypothetical protein
VSGTSAGRARAVPKKAIASKPRRRIVRNLRDVLSLGYVLNMDYDIGVVPRCQDQMALGNTEHPFINTKTAPRGGPGFQTKWRIMISAQIHTIKLP